MKRQIELLRREKPLSHTWIVTTMSLHTMSVIFMEWRKEPVSWRNARAIGTAKMPANCKQIACTPPYNFRMITSSFSHRKPAVVSAELDQLQIAQITGPALAEIAFERPFRFVRGQQP